MFTLETRPNTVRVGDMNVAASKAKLKELGIPILAEDTGLNYGRTVIFYPETGVMTVRSVGKEDKIL